MTAPALVVADALARLSPLDWAKLHVPDAVPTRYAPFHRQLVALPDPGEKQARVVFRGAAKTTLVRMLVLHCAVHRRVRGVLLVRNTFGDVRTDTKTIGDLCAARGIPFSKDWDAKMLVVNGVPIWMRTPGSSVRGIQWTDPETGEVVRPELIVIDDLESRESARSVSRTRELGAWMTSDAIATAAQGYPARVVMLGTPITPSALISQAMRRDGLFESWLPPLVVPIHTAAGEPVWPDNYDPTLAPDGDRPGGVPLITWWAEYMLSALPPGTVLFPDALTRWDALPPSSRFPLVVCVDPAGDGVDNTAAVAGCLTPRGVHFVDALSYDGSMMQAPDAVARFVRSLVAQGWQVRGVLVEGVGAWEFFKRDLFSKLAPIRVSSEPAGQLSKVERALPFTRWHGLGLVSADPGLRGSMWDAEFHSFTEDGVTVTQHDDQLDAAVMVGAVLSSGWKIQPEQLASNPPIQ